MMLYFICNLRLLCLLTKNPFINLRNMFDTLWKKYHSPKYAFLKNRERKCAQYKTKVFHL